ncbi:hypothetical protein ACFQ16_13985 [Saccharopolyspora rosea]|uniref:Uncharacterized protein n=1 Tax=Saccharopolyspora rosea TaxID=524884 RepID=A0ABW3FSN3_9PSEU
MRAVRRFAVCTAVSLAVGTWGPPVASGESEPPTTPIPAPEDPGQPPASMPTTAPGPVVADAGTMVGIVRLLPNTVPTDSIVQDPDFQKKLPKQAVAEFGMGRAIAQANSTAFFAHERATAEASPFGAALFGKAPQTPGSVVQTALPDHPQPTTEGLQPPPSPADQVVHPSAMTGSAQARWDEQLGPCVQPIADARMSLGGVSAVNALPSTAGDDALQRLGGLLDGKAPTTDGRGSLLHVPDAIQAHSTVRLADVPGQHGKAVQATSSMQVAGVRLFAGTPQEVRIDVVSAPRLTATATGDPGSSTVDYQAPVLRVSRGGRVLGTLDAANRQLDVPNVLDLGVLRLSAGELKKDVVGTEVRAGSELFDLQVLRGHPIGVPTSLVQVSFGEQVARASAPQGGVVCGGSAAPGPAPAAPPAAGPARQVTEPLALTSGAYYAVPLFWTGTGLLVLGSILVAALPRRRRP